MTYKINLHYMRVKPTPLAYCVLLDFKPANRPILALCNTYRSTKNTICLGASINRKKMKIQSVACTGTIFLANLSYVAFA